MADFQSRFSPNANFTNTSVCDVADDSLLHIYFYYFVTFVSN